MSNLQVNNTSSFYAELWKRCEVLAGSSLIPRHFQGKPGDVFLIAGYAHEQGESLLAMLRSTYVVKSNMGWSAAYLTAKANTSGIFKGPIRYVEKEGSCQCWAILRETEERIDGPIITRKMAADCRWDFIKPGSQPGNWQTQPQTMLRKRAATYFVREYCPEVLLGFRTDDELNDMDAAGVLEAPRDVEAEANVDNAMARLDELSAPELNPEEVEVIAEGGRLSIKRKAQAFPENGKPDAGDLFGEGGAK